MTFQELHKRNEFCFVIRVGHIFGLPKKVKLSFVVDEGMDWVAISGLFCDGVLNESKKCEDVVVGIYGGPVSGSGKTVADGLRALSKDKRENVFLEAGAMMKASIMVLDFGLEHFNLKEGVLILWFIGRLQIGKNAVH